MPAPLELFSKGKSDPRHLRRFEDFLAFFLAAFFFLAIVWLPCVTLGCRSEESLRNRSGSTRTCTFIVISCEGPLPHFSKHFEKQIKLTPFQPSKPLQLVLVGASGRMGRSIQQAVSKLSSVTIVCAVDRGPQTPKNADVVMDFSSDEGALRAVDIAVDLNAALLVGTTGLSQKTLLAIQKAAQSIPAIKISNSSLGIAILTRMAAQTAAILGSGAAISIHERHHSHKKDSPSGTALTLAQALREAGGTVADGAIRGMREGEIVGEHRVTFEMENEILAFEHRALDRELFAIGALRIADWLRRQPAGMHTIDQWLSDLLLPKSKP